jgi:hypothetical protein
MEDGRFQISLTFWQQLQPFLGWLSVKSKVLFLVHYIRPLKLVVLAHFNKTTNTPKRKKLIQQIEKSGIYTKFWYSFEYYG